MKKTMMLWLFLLLLLLPKFAFSADATRLQSVVALALEHAPTLRLKILPWGGHGCCPMWLPMVL